MCLLGEPAPPASSVQRVVHMDPVLAAQPPPLYRGRAEVQRAWATPASQAWTVETLESEENVNCGTYSAGY